MNHFVACFFSLNVLFLPVINSSNLYKEIAKENLKSFKNELLAKKSDALNNLMSSEKKFSQVVYEKLDELLSPTQKAKQETVFSLLSEYEEKHHLEESQVLDKITWQDLNLLCGSASDPTMHLARVLDRTSTGLGRIIFYRKLIQPQHEYQKLINQQNIVKELVNNDGLFNDLEKELKQLDTLENSFLSFWNDEFFASLFKNNGNIQLPFADKVERIKKINGWLNKNVACCEISGKTSELQLFIMSAATLTGGITLTSAGLSRFSTHHYAHQLQEFSQKFGMGALAAVTSIGALCYALRFFYKNNLTYCVTDVTSGAISAAGSYKLLDSFKTSIALNHCLQVRLVHVARYFEAVKNMIKHVQQYNIGLNISGINNYNQTLEEIQNKSKDIKKLLALLETKTFKREQTSYFSMWGRIIVGYRLMMELKDQLVDTMLVAGELDAYMGIARLYKEFQNKKITFCFPTYQQNTTPFINIKQFWNPFITPEKVIPNSLAIGNKQPQSIIVSGPNAGGKSTTIKGSILAIILGQSLGIAPAEELIFTPFSKIITYLNITDDIAAGNSHFIAETKRARDLITTTQMVDNTHNFSLMAADEVFNGTTYKEGQAAAYSLIEQLGNCKNNVCITCTHFPKVAALEKETNNFTNYKVSVSYDKSGRIAYPYKLERGITNQIVTFDILKEKGFGDKFLERAQKLLP